MQTHFQSILQFNTSNTIETFYLDRDMTPYLVDIGLRQGDGLWPFVLNSWIVPVWTVACIISWYHASYQYNIAPAIYNNRQFGIDQTWARILVLDLYLWGGENELIALKVPQDWRPVSLKPFPLYFIWLWYSYKCLSMPWQFIRI